MTMTMRLPMTLLLPTEPLVKALRSLPRFQEMIQQAMGNAPHYQPPKRKYKKSLFDPELRAQYQSELQQLMISERLFLDPGLTLRSVAVQIKLPPNHLSQLLNEGFEQNFPEFVNFFRLDTFKTLAADPTQQHLTILALAYASGFNSKTVFNTFFKKMTEKRPKCIGTKFISRNRFRFTNPNDPAILQPYF